MWKIVCVSILWIVGATIGAQEYLPPKAGGKKEPTMPANYNFSYDVQDSGATLDFGHNEKRKEDKVTGSFHVLLPDGRMQLVEYEAGPDGYKPQVMYMGKATYPEAKSDKFDGYHYNAASNRQSVRQPAPREHRGSLSAASEHISRSSASGSEHIARGSLSAASEHIARGSASAASEHIARGSASAANEHIARGSARQATAVTPVSTSDAPTHAPTLHIPPTNSSQGH